jgi:hypothetical protein
MKPAALKPRPASADIKRRPAPATSREWDSTVNDLSEYRLSEKQLQAKVQARHAASKVVSLFYYFLLPTSALAPSHSSNFVLSPLFPQIDYNPLAELQKWEEIQRKEDSSFASAGRRCVAMVLHCTFNTRTEPRVCSTHRGSERSTTPSFPPAFA